MSYVNFNRALTKAQIEALGETGTAVNGKIYFATDDGIYVGNADGSVSLKANAGGDITSEPLGPIDDPTNAYYTRTQTDTLLSVKQNTLVSGTNIKTVNNQSLLGSGDITIDPNNTFIARYNETSFADVKSAYLAGKIVVCLYNSIADGDGEDLYLSLHNYYTDDGPGYEWFMFTGIDYTMSYQVYLNEDGDYWDGGSISLSSQSDVNNRVPFFNTSNKSVQLYGGYPLGYGSLTLYGGRASVGGSLAMGYASNNTNTTNNSIQAKDYGTIAGGYSTKSPGIVAEMRGGIAFGYNTTNNTKIVAESPGATAMGSTSVDVNGVTYSGNLYALGTASHAEGVATAAEGQASHTEGIKTATSGAASHAEGFGTVAGNFAEHAEGKYNESHSGANDSDNTISSIGIGTDGNNTKNAFEVMQNGDAYLLGVGGYDGTNPGGSGVKTLQDTINDNPFESGTGENSAKLRNSGSVADSDYSLAIGYNTYAGLKGYKWLTHTAISVGANTLTLTTTPDWAVGDTISVVTKNGKYHNVATVVSVNNTVVTLEYAEVEPNFTGSDNDPNNAVYCLEKPAIGDIDLGEAAHAEGVGSVALNVATHAEGTATKALGHHAHTEGYQTEAYFAAHAEGQNTVARGQASHTEGARTESTGPASHAEGADTVASGERAHAEGDYTKAFGNYSHAEGKNTDAEGNYAHAEGYMTMAIGDFSHVEGINSQAEGNSAHAEGSGTRANGYASHAEGSLTRATGDYAHAEGLGSNSTGATGNRAHSEGYQTTASGNDSHAEGFQTSASGARTHAEGSNTTATNLIEHAEGRYNKSNKASSSFGNAGNTLHSVGIGSSSSSRVNAFEIMQNGDVYVKGVGTYNGTNPTSGTNDVKSVIDSKAPLVSPALTGTPTAPTAASGTNTTQIATTAFVKTAIDNLPEPMIFKGSLGTGGTISTLPAASASNEGHTYKVITAGTYAGQSAKVGDTFISTGTEWVLIPSGDEPSGTVTNVATGSGLTGGPITSSGTISHANSGVTAGTYKSVTVDSMGHVTAGTNPTTLSGYGITDGIKYGDVLQPTNPFGGKTLYINSIDNALAAANKKFWVVVTKHNKVVNGVTYPYIDSTKTMTDDNYFVDSPVVGTLESLNLFDGSYDSSLSATPGTYLKVHIQFAPITDSWTPSGSTSYFSGYPYGNFYLSYYYTSTPTQSSQLRVYNKYTGHTVGWHLYNGTTYAGTPGSSNYIEQITDNSDYHRTCLEFIIFGRDSESSVNVSPTQIDYRLSRPNLSRDGSTVTKYGDQKLYYNFSWYNHIDNAQPAETVSINSSSGEVKATKFTKSGGTSSQFLKADGSVDSTVYGTYSKPAGGIPASDLASNVLALVPGTGTKSAKTDSALVDAHGEDSLAIGHAVCPEDIVSIKANSDGSVAIGEVIRYDGGNDPSILAGGTGSIAIGSVSGGGQIQTTSSGAFAGGVVASDGYNSCYIKSQNNGSFAFGSATGNYEDMTGQWVDARIVASGHGAHAEGYADAGEITASGNGSHAEGVNTTAQNEGEHAEGKFNLSHRVNGVFGNAGNTIHSIGIGYKYNDEEQWETVVVRKNALEIMQNGDVYIKGVGTYDGTNPNSGVNDVKTVIDNKVDKILMEKTFDPYTAAANDQPKGWIYFMNVVPTDDNWAVPWSIRYRLFVSTEEIQTQGKYDCTIGTEGTNVIYLCYNEYYSGSYVPISNHLISFYNSSTKYANRETYPIKIGAKMQSARKPTTLARTFKIQIIETVGCTVSFTDTIETYDSYYDANKYGQASQISGSMGLQETGDVNYANYYNYYYYNGFRLSDANAPLYRYKLVGFDEKMRVIPFNITDQQSATIIEKTPCSLGFTVSNGMGYYGTTTTISSTTTAIASGTIYRDHTATSSGTVALYNFNTVVGNSSNDTLHSNVYWCGDYDPITDKFYLDRSTSTSWYTVASNNADNATWKQSFQTGKYYWLIGQTCESDGYFAFLANHPLYYFDGDKLVPEIVLKQNKPVVIYETDGATGLLGLQSNISDNPAWQLTGLNLSPYKRIKIYTKCSQKNSATPSASTTPAMVLEMILDSRAGGPYSGHFVGSVVSQNPNDANRLSTLTCAVSADKTSFAVLRMNTLYGTAATSNNDVNGYVFLIEGYYN